jgi:hypothetical protein
VCGVGAWASVQSASGAEVWRSSPIAAMCTNPPPQPPRLNPGQSVGYPAGTWNQQICSSSGSCSAAAAGGYHAVGHRGTSAGKPARFRLTS